MKKLIFSLAVLLCSMSAITAKAQVSIEGKVGTPVYCLPPARVVVVVPPLKRGIMVKPAPAILVRPRYVIVMSPPPAYVVARPARKVVIYR